MSEGLPSTGVTSFLPTTLAPLTSSCAVTENIGARYQEASGAKPWDLFEGLQKYKGPKTLPIRPSYGWFRAWQKAANGL